MTDNRPHTEILIVPRSIQTTQRYIDGDSDVQRKLVSLI